MPIGEESLKYDGDRIPNIPAFGFKDTDFWEHLFKMAPIEMVVEAAAEFISAVTNLRIKEDICFFSTVDVGEGSLSFKHHWISPSLLSIMWFLFYLEKTGQMIQKYRICLHCSEPIYPKAGEEKVHAKRQYHEGCRQKKFQRGKNRVVTMYKEGKSLSEILKEFPEKKEDTIRKWIEETEKNKVK